MTKRLFRVDVVWREAGHYMVEAESADEAREIAMRCDALPDEQDGYVDDSLLVTDVLATDEHQPCLRTGMDVMAERGIDITRDSFTGDDFAQAGLPMFCECTRCGEQMVFSSERVRVADGYAIYCADCIG